MWARGDPVTVEEAQVALQAIAGELLGIEDRLQAIAAQLPQSANRDAMQEGKIPYDVATDLLGTIEVVVVDDIRPAFRRLERASRVTDTDLRQGFQTS
jgi:hypothetical protein